MLPGLLLDTYFKRKPLVFTTTTTENGDFQLDLFCDWLAFSSHGIGYVLAPHRRVGTSLTLCVGTVLEPVLSFVGSVLAPSVSRVGPVLAPCWPASFRVGPNPWWFKFHVPNTTTKVTNLETNCKNTDRKSDQIFGKSSQFFVPI